MKHTFKGGKYWGIPLVKIGYLDQLILIIYPVLQVACEAHNINAGGNFGASPRNVFGILDPVIIIISSL